MTSRLAPLQIVTEAAPAAATWAEAKRLVAEIRAGGRAWLELGEVLEVLRTEFFAQGAGGGGDRKSFAANVKITSPHGAVKWSPADERGWQAKVREELGISDDTARRWMLDGHRYRQMRLICAGRVDEVDGHLVTDTVRKEARAAIAEIDSDPTMRPARKWAGLWSAVKTKGSQRKAIDHATNIARGLTALQTSLPHWTDLKPEQRAALERGWELVRPLLPPTFQ
jgi:hypothetical protein